MRLAPLTGLAIGLLVPLLTGCPSLPPPDRLAFDTDPRVLRGSYRGFADTREVPRLMALAGDGSVLAASWPDSVQLWDVTTLEPIASIDMPAGDDGWVGGLSVDGTGSLVAGIVGGNVLVWDARDGTLVRTFDPGDRLGGCLYCGVYEMALSPGGDLVAAAGGAPQVLVVDAGTGAVVQELDSGGERVGLVAFSSDGSLLASGSHLSDTGYAVRVWETATYTVVFERQGTVSANRVPRFAFSADGVRLAVGSATKLEVFPLAGGQTVLPVDESAGEWLWALSADGTQAAFERQAEYGSDLAIVDVSTGATLALFTDLLWGQTAWSADGHHLFVGAELVGADDFEVAKDFAIGQLYELTLDATPRYANSRTYTVSGTLRIDGGADVEFNGTVDGNESQRYLRPQARAPEPATLEIELHGHPWKLHGQQSSNQWYMVTVGPEGWWGYVTVSSQEEGTAWHPFQLWRAP